MQAPTTHATPLRSMIIQHHRYANVNSCHHRVLHFVSNIPVLLVVQPAQCGRAVSQLLIFWSVWNADSFQNLCNAAWLTGLVRNRIMYLSKYI